MLLQVNIVIEGLLPIMLREFGIIDQDTTFEELGHSKIFFPSKGDFEVFLENMGTRNPCRAFLIDFVESARFQQNIKYFLHVSFV